MSGKTCRHFSFRGGWLGVTWVVTNYWVRFTGWGILPMANVMSVNSIPPGTWSRSAQSTCMSLCLREYVFCWVAENLVWVHVPPLHMARLPQGLTYIHVSSIILVLGNTINKIHVRMKALGAQSRKEGYGVNIGVTGRKSIPTEVFSDSYFRVSGGSS